MNQTLIATYISCKATINNIIFRRIHLNKRVEIFIKIHFNSLYLIFISIFHKQL